MSDGSRFLLGSYLPTIVDMDSCPQSAIFLIPPVEMVRFITPDGTELEEKIEVKVKQCGVIKNFQAIKEKV